MKVSTFLQRKRKERGCVICDTYPPEAKRDIVEYAKAREANEACGAGSFIEQYLYPKYDVRPSGTTLLKHVRRCLERT
ncbi:MAG: hypothetical protein ACF8XB_14090 [Planctomycetota bacterium JB042]